MNTSKSTKTTTKKRNLRRRVLTKKPIKRRRIRRVVPIRGRRIAAASAKQFKKKFKVFRQNGTSVRVSGRDLIYSIPDDNTAPVQDTSVIAVLPANPVYWRGSRIAALASGYQNYRPIRFKVTYVPIVAVTQQGNVIGGTIWDNGFEADNVQQSLRTSNGGFLTQCYIPHTTQIRPKSNLQFNLYRVGGAFNQQSNPFVFIALAIGCKDTTKQRIIPGYFYVTWTFELKNPIGTNGRFVNSGLTTYNTIQPALNTTLVNIDLSAEIPFGAYIDVEVENDALVPKYNNTPIELEQNTPVWAFQSLETVEMAKAKDKNIIYYFSVDTNQYLRFPENPTRVIIIENNDQDSYYTIKMFSYDLANKYYRTETTPTFLGQTDQILGVFYQQMSIPIYPNQSPVNPTNYPCSIYHAEKSQFAIQLQTTQTPKQVKHPKTRYKPDIKVKSIINELKIKDDKPQINNKNENEINEIINEVNEINLDHDESEEEIEQEKLFDAKSQNIIRNKNLRIKQPKQLPIP